MAKESAQQLDQPAKAPQAPGVEARIFAMPERYRHGAQAVMHQPKKKEEVKPPVEVKTPSIPPPPKAPPKAVSPKKKRSTTKIILIVGGVILVLLAAGAFFLLREPDASEPASQPTTTTRPAPVTEEPEEEVGEEPEEEPEEEADVFETTITPGVDSDSDGLTDTEENLVYNTDPRLPDTDSDGFLDGNEVFHRYNPGGTAPGTLLESGLVQVLAAEAGTVAYELYYPSVWEVDEKPGEFVLDADTGEGFRISFEQKPSSTDLEEWVEENLDLTRPLIGTTKNGLAWLQSEDQLTAYVDVGQAVLVIEYDTGIKSRVDYLQTFQMMLNSIEVTGEVALEEEGVDSGEVVEEEVISESEEDADSL